MEPTIPIMQLDSLLCCLISAGRPFYVIVTSVTYPLFPTPGFASTVTAVRPSAAEAHSQRNAVFSREQARQRALYPRIEKIEVSMQGPGLDGTLLVMNKGMSTPLSCTRRE